MKRPLAVLTAAALLALLVLMPLGAAANADTGGAAQIENVSAGWRDGTFSVRYGWENIGIADDSTYPSGATSETLVDGAVVETVHAESYESADEHLVQVPRAKAAGLAAVWTAVTSCVARRYTVAT